MKLLGIKKTATFAMILVLMNLWPQPVSDGDALAAEEQQVAAVDASTGMFVAEAVVPEVPAEEMERPADPAAPVQTESADFQKRAAAPPMDIHAVFARLAAGDRTGGLPQTDVYETPEQPTVYLTFDDGPTKLTLKVLDILQAYQVKATFFVLGELAEKQEELIRRIHREGHALGNHTYNHKYDELYGNFSSFWQQVVRTDEILTEITGEKTSLLRAPGGTATNFDAFYFHFLQIAGYQVHDWTVDSGDSKRRGVPASEIVNNVKKAKLTHEMTVLLHDGAGHAETVKALPEIIEYFQEKGYRFAKLDERVKPVMFQMRDVKWERFIDERQFEHMLAVVTGTDLNAAEPQEQLRIDEHVLVASADHGTEKPEGRVALRDWAAEFGTVVWDASKAAAVVEAEGVVHEFYVKTGDVQRLDADGQRVPVDIEFEMEENHILLPLSETPKLQLLPPPLIAEGMELPEAA